ncbi:hypothetical protein [Lacticaseibacillus rhamnosus]|uniref:hypothetical protein n=1 Tax=Lacticaseibacillus rhamnosus TaxID=47715 RepID=UPI0029163877|nr:hypothetical protein [Lacticaseibacillus rhamnosus]WNX15370.1 hypothetical protein RWA20_07660 [Lacticaseibacillus rhamnosus]
MENKEISIDTFSVLNSVGWTMIILRLANITSTPWEAIANYFLFLAAIGLTMGILTALINMWTHKGGDKGGEK